MGSGIAQVAASHGHPVVVVDADGAALTRARDALAKAIGREVEKGRVDSARGAEILARISYAQVAAGEPLTALAESAMVIEAIVERLDVKRDTFARLEAAVASDALLATNTSSLPIAGIAAPCRHPERVLGVHFFNPAPVMPLVEIVPAIATSSDVTSTAR